jgi:hypothetical protein
VVQASGRSLHLCGYGCGDARIKSALYNLPIKFKLDGGSLLPAIFRVPLIVCGSGVEGLLNWTLVKLIVKSDHFVYPLLLFWLLVLLELKLDFVRIVQNTE